MRKNRRDRRHRVYSDLPVGEVDQKVAKRRDFECVAAFFALLLLTMGGLFVLSAMQEAENARRLSKSTIRSASALRGAVQGQPVVLSGRIDPQTPVSVLDLAIYYGEREERTHGTGRYGGLTGPPRWFRYGPAHRPPFTLVTDGVRLPINGHYAIKEPSVAHELGRLRWSGFQPGDEILVIGTTVEGGISATTVSGGTPTEYWTTLATQPERMAVLRRYGLGLIGLGLIPLALWVRLRGERPECQPRGQLAT
jgi:hypothetical protein